ncbi:hypothetical protein CHS0354_004814, partial [Potamilus streckersoni]
WMADGQNGPVGLIAHSHVTVASPSEHVHVNLLQDIHMVLNALDPKLTACSATRTCA